MYKKAIIFMMNIILTTMDERVVIVRKDFISSILIEQLCGIQLIIQEVKKIEIILIFLIDQDNF
jgi:hypothetical protein